MEKPIKILVIDDETPIREVISLALEDEGYVVTATNSGVKGLQLAKDSSFDIVLSDIKMPGLTGVEVAKTLLSSPFNGGIILMTGYPGEYTEESVLSIGIDAYLKKPFKILDLFHVVRSVIAKRNLV